MSAQAKGNGKGKPPKTSCDEASYPATVEFLNHPITGQPPAIYAAGDPSPGDPTAEDPVQVLFDTWFANGRVRDYLQNPQVDGKPGSPLLPLHLDFSGGGSHYGDYDHPLGSDQIDIDPRLSIWAIADLETLETPECGMLGMVVLDWTSYAGRTGFLWRESELGVPVGPGGRLGPAMGSAPQAF